jgi:hypothetical protein
MLPAEFEPAVLASKWPLTHTLDHVVSGFGCLVLALTLFDIFVVVV